MKEKEPKYTWIRNSARSRSKRLHVFYTCALRRARHRVLCAHRVHFVCLEDAFGTRPPSWHSESAQRVGRAVVQRCFVFEMNVTRFRNRVK
ncbi:uncharacterized [Tachysurus ichikawai]